MIKRNIAPLLPAISAGYPVLVITGPRQAGKNTLARLAFPEGPYYPDGAILDEVQLGLWEDVKFITHFWSDDDLRRALEHAPAGIFDPASWHYRHHRLGINTIPPLPRRSFSLKLTASR